MPNTNHTVTVPSGIILQVISPCLPKDREALAAKVAKLEKKIFPSSEAFDYGIELKKKNIGLILASREGSQEAVGYLVFQRQKSLAWLHKLATIEQERGKGIARCLVHSLSHQMNKGGCRTIFLWVDEARAPARALYASCGFQQVERLPDYYGPGRTAVKMELAIVE
ncbi:acyl-CoA N-acyltransferase [Didymella exigua CBS 183.55]|uniref:Acyl-CoA N-acyltransferase n=1 Tax=Didymella exigua CBS 183.55 TaxID=1150837 RepID=A0A6A5RLU3_9PLEO|nr:acyl-CoA N-acyltransferase [Didymella exigua CBS 183.55]KAF1928629.1 acyl-CoA N-acyltransferase [Didymella exigua CBS 183.55]